MLVKGKYHAKGSKGFSATNFGKPDQDMTQESFTHIKKKFISYHQSTFVIFDYKKNIVTKLELRWFHLDFKDT